MLAAFAALVALTGGGARSDIASLVILRPISVLVLGYAVYVVSRAEVHRVRPLLWGVAAIAIIAALQLVPLPPGLWRALPGRSEFAAGLDLAAVGQVWRPASLVPAATLNALFSLAVPAATLLLVARQNERQIPKLRTLLLVIAGISGLFGIAQVVGADDGPLYTYRITNNGTAVGLFANRNHHAIFLSTVFPMLAAAVRPSTRGPRGRRTRTENAMLAIFAGLILLVVLSTGSRAGLALAAGAILSSGAILWLASGSGIGGLLGWFDPRAGGESFAARAIRGFRLALPLTAVVALVGLSLLFSRSEAIDRLFASDVVEDVRFAVFPYLIDLVWQYFPVGSGFGSFEYVFRAIEPDELLRTTYLNQAHNDLLQIVIEAGVPGLALVLAGLFAFVRRALSALFALRKGGGSKPLLACLAVLVVLLGSLSDYPLRSPLGMLWFAILTALMVRSGSEPGDRQQP